MKVTFDVAGILHGFGRFVAEVIFCRFRLGSYRSTSVRKTAFFKCCSCVMMDDKNLEWLQSRTALGLGPRGFKDPLPDGHTSNHLPLTTDNSTH
ncbi:hypothetical protein ASZ78_007434 [Callipepla squamata]|uniref:Uncharacterized protein n=1 Tax=Callipepla squamata TaxID=9009 RepID=A0A226MZ44_CALSU|nr:hypothetical protein ASZ78_007434 [Callipepla squamata]